MLNNFIGKKDFQKGLQNYLKKFAYKNANTDDLWDELNKTASNNKNVKSLMRNWTQKCGYPLVSVVKKIDDNGHTILEMKQCRFFKSIQEFDDSLDTLWSIPITIVTKSSFPSTFKEILMTDRSIQVDIGCLDAKNDFVYLNSDTFSFMRVFYSTEMFETLLDKIPFFGTSLDRFGFVSDVFAMTWSNRYSGKDLMRLIWSLRNERDTHVMIVLLKNLHSLSKCLVNTRIFEQFKKFLNKFLETISLDVGFFEQASENDLVKLVRENVLYFLAKVDDKTFHDHALKLYENRHTIKISSNLQKPVYTSILRNITKPEVLDEFIQMYTKCTIPEEKEKIALLLAELNTRDLINKILELAFSVLNSLF
jgi:hypothetical protein